MKHRGEYKFKCSICSKGFYQKAHFQGHLNSHRNVCPNWCPKCGKQFLYSQDIGKTLINVEFLRRTLNVKLVAAREQSSLQHNFLWITRKDTTKWVMAMYVINAHFKHFMCKHMRCTWILINNYEMFFVV